jgi:tRNA(Ile2) C34 agmatinyltransferase TiaS
MKCPNCNESMQTNIEEQKYKCNICEKEINWVANKKSYELEQCND